MIARLAPSVKTVTHPSSSSPWRLLPSPEAGLVIAPAASSTAGDTGTGSRAPPPAARAEAAALAARFAAASTWRSSPPAAAAEMAAAAAARVTAVLRLRSPERSWPACMILTLNDCRALGEGELRGGSAVCVCAHTRRMTDLRYCSILQRASSEEFREEATHCHRHIYVRVYRYTGIDYR